MSTRNIQVIYAKEPQGFPDPDTHFEIRKSTITLSSFALAPKQLLLRNLWISVDPYIRGRLRDPEIESYLPAIQLGGPVSGFVVAEVVKSSDPKFGEGDVVATFANWEEYTVLDTIPPPGSAPYEITVIPNARSSPVPLSYYTGVLGMPGATAYIGLQKHAQPLQLPDGRQQTIYISAASGAVGQVVGQHSKALGLRVVGSAGDDAKVAYLLNEIGFDAAFNYKKNTDFDRALKEACPDGIDIYFENVGGKMLDAVLANANNFARIVVCGLISEYNSAPEPLHNIMHLLTKRIRMEGFMVIDEWGKYGENCVRTFVGLIQQGKLKYKETVAEGIENAPRAFVDMLHGKNFGKAVVKVAEL